VIAPITATTPIAHFRPALLRAGGGGGTDG
jgi:hypothetical protein